MAHALAGDLADTDAAAALLGMLNNKGKICDLISVVRFNLINSNWPVLGLARLYWSAGALVCHHALL